MQIPSDKELLDRIEAFLERHAMAPTRFGRDATGEPQLIESMRTGRSPSLKTLRRIASFMNDYDAMNETSPGKTDEISPSPDGGNGDAQGSKAA